MKNKTICWLCISFLFSAIILSNCIKTKNNDISNYNFSLHNTVSIFLLKDENNGYYFCIPVQYIGNYQIQAFEYDNGSIIIGDYEILLKREELNIFVYLNETADESGNSNGEFNLIYMEENNKVSISKMNEPLAIKNDPDSIFNHYYIFIEKHLNSDEINNLIIEYNKGNINSYYSIWYDLIIDNKEQNGSGMIDNFELFNGPLQEYVWLFDNLEFFRNKYKINE